MTDTTTDQSGAGEQPLAEVEQPDPALEQPDDAAGSQEGEGEDELEEVEFEGRKFSVPKSAKAALDQGVMRQADYTRKTQAVAEDRRALEADRAAHEATFEERVKVSQFKAQIEALDDAINDGHQRFQNIDWAALKALPDGDMRLQQAQIELRSLENTRQKLVDQKTKLESELGEKAKASTAQQQQATAKLIEQRDAQLAKDVPGWPKLRPEVEAFALKQGITKAELDATADPRIFRMLRYAKLGLEAEQRSQKAAGGDEAAPALRPATTLTAPGRAAPSGPTMKDSPEEWARKRNAQIAAARAPRGARR
jgi:hypothetical protein